MHSKHFKWLNPGIQQNIVRLGRYFCIRLGLSFIETLFQKSFLVFFTAFIGRELNHFIFFYYIYYFFYDIYIGCSMLVFVNFFFCIVLPEKNSKILQLGFFLSVFSSVFVSIFRTVFVQLLLIAPICIAIFSSWAVSSYMLT